MILLDANILVYALIVNAPQHAACVAVVTAALAGRIPGVAFPQTLLEFWSVVTNPRRVQRPLNPVRAWERVNALRSGLQFLDLRPDAFGLLDRLVVERRPTGREIFDLFLVAQMRSHGVTMICTYNTSDFVGLPGIEALTAEEALARWQIV
ncbi:MAG: PIN domain-containing protein [Chloroflexi bacterium]|nr:PIN domain-containing protein [Chloroflexota bacterium]